MPLKRKKEAEEAKKNEGGNELNQDQIRSIVEQVLDEKKEKGELSQEIAELRKGIKDANEGLAGLRQLFCTEDGTICFPTQEQLNVYLEKQDTRAKELDGKIGEVVSQIKTITEAKPAPEGPGLAGIPEDKKGFEELPLEQQKRIKSELAERIPHSLLLDIVKECSHSDSPEKCLLLESVLKDYDAGEIFAELPVETRGQAILLGCEDGACRVQLEKEQGVRIYKKNDRGKYVWMDEPEREGPHI